MKPHEHRVLEEKAQLDEKLQKLEAFFQTDTFRMQVGFDDQTLLRMQHAAMASYSAILGQRIAKFS